MKNSRNVVLDGSNIIAGGARGKDSDGRRLVSAINLYTKKGYNVIPVMYQGTYTWMRKNNIRGFDVIEKLNKQNSEIKLRLFGKGDDLYIIQIAIEFDAWIVTQDSFQSKERELFPDWPWDKIDSKTWGTKKCKDGKIRTSSEWSIMGAKFLHPSLKPCNKSGLIDDYCEHRRILSEICEKINQLESITDSEKNNQTSLLEEFKKIQASCKKIYRDLPKPRIPNIDEMDSILVPQLREICRSLGIKISGRRAELIERISNYEPIKVHD
tara:strand:- start:25989 stop:26792 length:804 start_codon:yes stop_codon:yes gene_type:complete